MGPRYSTQKQDEQIMVLILKGIPPKTIHKKLNLISINVVYNALRRWRKKRNDISKVFSSDHIF